MYQDERKRAFARFFVFLKGKEDIQNRIQQLVESVCESEGIELVLLEYRRESGGLILRIYIDKPGGVTLDNCTSVSRQLDDLLDIHFDELPPYTLEVSSPGIDRPLVKKGDYVKFMGKSAKIKTKMDEVNKVLQEASTELYQKAQQAQAQKQQEQQAGQGATGKGKEKSTEEKEKDEAVDADYTMEDEDKKK